jgi:hypothetical protein
MTTTTKRTAERKVTRGEMFARAMAIVREVAEMDEHHNPAAVAKKARVVVAEWDAACRRGA